MLIDAQAAKDPSGTIFATTRNPADSEELNEVASKSNGKVIVVKCDMIGEESVKVFRLVFRKRSSKLTN